MGLVWISSPGCARVHRSTWCRDMATGRLAAWYRGRTWETLVARAVPLSRDALTGPALVVAPHPDDEVLGCGGTILAKKALGARIGIVYVSDGSASHASHMDPAELADRRKTEAKEASSRLGVADEDLFFLGIRDGGVRQADEASRLGFAEILETFRPEQIFTPYHADGVADHEDTTALVAASVQESSSRPEILEYPIWFWHHWPWTVGRVRDRFPRWLRRARQSRRSMSRLRRDFRCVVDISDHLEGKKRALEAHASQMVREPGCAQWPILSDISDGEWLDLFFRRFECFHRREQISDR